MGALDRLLGWLGLARIPENKEANPMRVVQWSQVQSPTNWNPSPESGSIDLQVIQLAYAQGEDAGRRSLLGELEKIVFERNPNACQFEAEDVESLRRGMLH